MQEFVKVHRVYLFNELSPKAKDHVREQRQSDWDSGDEAMLTESMACFLQEKYPYFPSDKIAYSLSYSQGDGASFHGSIDLEELAKVVNGSLWLAVQIAIKYNVDFEINRFNNRYCHWNTIRVDHATTQDIGDNGQVESRRMSLLDNLRDWLQAESKTACLALEEMGYADIEYRFSDDAIVEESESNSWRYTESGNLVSDIESDSPADILEIIEKDLYREAKSEKVIGTPLEVQFLEARAALSEIRNYKL